MKSQVFPSRSWRLFLLIALLLMSANSVVLAQTTTFTYQGRLTDVGTPANGNYDLQFALFDSASSGGQIGSNQTLPNVSVSNGIFTVALDFGANAFTGANRYLEISARLANNGPFTLLSPRQQISSTPYAIRTLNATTADTAMNATQLGGLAASQYVQTNDSRLSDPRHPTPGDSNYIQNTSAPQASSNFNVSGNGTAGGTLSGNAVNATTQYNIGGNRVLSVTGQDNTFAGFNAGQHIETETFLTGFGNSFFGRFAGFANEASNNSFFGAKAGEFNTSGGQNSFFGNTAGVGNTTGEQNSFFGYGAGNVNTKGDLNAFFGLYAGNANDGSNNSFFGSNAGNSNTTGDYNTVIGQNADVGSGNLNHATAIGAGAIVNTSNTIVLGRADGSDFVKVPGFLTIPNLAAAGTTQLCLNSFFRVGACSSSLRYKTNLAAYRSGLSVINRLRPISFTWKEGGMRDLGFGAEDVEQIDPLLVTYNKEGQVEGVKYDRINVVLVNAIREQQDQIERQQAEVRQQQNQIEALRTANVALNARLRGIEKVLRKSAGASRRRR